MSTLKNPKRMAHVVCLAYQLLGGSASDYKVLEEVVDDQIRKAMLVGIDEGWREYERQLNIMRSNGALVELRPLRIKGWEEVFLNEIITDAEVELAKEQRSI